MATDSQLPTLTFEEKVLDYDVVFTLVNIGTVSKEEYDKCKLAQTFMCHITDDTLIRYTMTLTGTRKEDKIYVRVEYADVSKYLEQELPVYPWHKKEAAIEDVEYMTSHGVLFPLLRSLGIPITRGAKKAINEYIGNGYDIIVPGKYKYGMETTKVCSFCGSAETPENPLKECECKLGLSYCAKKTCQADHVQHKKAHAIAMAALESKKPLTSKELKTLGLEEISKERQEEIQMSQQDEQQPVSYIYHISSEPCYVGTTVEQDRLPHLVSIKTGEVLKDAVGAPRGPRMGGPRMGGLRMGGPGMGSGPGPIPIRGQAPLRGAQPGMMTARYLPFGMGIPRGTIPGGAPILGGMGPMAGPRFPSTGYRRPYYPWYSWNPWYMTGPLMAGAALGAMTYPLLFGPRYYGTNISASPMFYSSVPYGPPSLLFDGLGVPPDPMYQPQQWQAWWATVIQRAYENGMLEQYTPDWSQVRWIRPAIGVMPFYSIPSVYRPFIEQQWQRQRIPPVVNV